MFHGIMNLLKCCHSQKILKAASHNLFVIFSVYLAINHEIKKPVATNVNFCRPFKRRGESILQKHSFSKLDVTTNIFALVQAIGFNFPAFFIQIYFLYTKT